MSMVRRSAPTSSAVLAFTKLETDLLDRLIPSDSKRRSQRHISDDVTKLARLGGYLGPVGGPASDATLSVSVTNYDPVDYAPLDPVARQSGKRAAGDSCLPSGSPARRFLSTLPTLACCVRLLLLARPHGSGYVDSAFLGCSRAISFPCPLSWCAASSRRTWVRTDSLATGST
jgi:hypothetical protein